MPCDTASAMMSASAWCVSVIVLMVCYAVLITNVPRSLRDFTWNTFPVSLFNRLAVCLMYPSFASSLVNTTLAQAARVFIVPLTFILVSITFSISYIVLI